MEKNMSEILTINTEENTVVKQNIEPLPVFGDQHPMLRFCISECDVSQLPNQNMSALVSRLKMTMKLYGGIGLAANQCGVLERVFVIGTDDFVLTCINPKIINQSEELVKDNEGCLSFPGMFLKVERPKVINVEFYDEYGKQHNMTIEGVTARCFLHELDHLNGFTFTDKVGPVALRLAKQRQQKVTKKILRSKK